MTTRDMRLNSTKRRELRNLVLKQYGNGKICHCLLGCKKPLDYQTMTMDRIIPGAFGGRYTIINVRPACEKDNKRYGGVLGNLKSRFPLTLEQWQDLERKGVIDQMLRNPKGRILPVEAS